MPDKTVPRSGLRSLPHWEEIEVRLRHRWNPHDVVEWHREHYPRELQPAAQKLKAYVLSKPRSWFVKSLAIGSFTPSHVPRILVLQEQAALIEIQTIRISKLLAREGDTGKYTTEVRHNLELLLKMHASHLEAQQGLGLEPAYGRGRRPETHAAASVGGDSYSSFLTPWEAQRMAELEDLRARGEIDLVELYRRIEGLFPIENGQRPGTEPP